MEKAKAPVEYRFNYEYCDVEWCWKNLIDENEVQLTDEYMKLTNDHLDDKSDLWASSWETIGTNYSQSSTSPTLPPPPPITAPVEQIENSEVLDADLNLLDNVEDSEESHNKDDIGLDED